MPGENCSILNCVKKSWRKTGCCSSSTSWNWCCFERENIYIWRKKRKFSVLYYPVLNPSTNTNFTFKTRNIFRKKETFQTCWDCKVKYTYPIQLSWSNQTDTSNLSVEKGGHTYLNLQVTAICRKTGCCSSSTSWNWCCFKERIQKKVFICKARRWSDSLSWIQNRSRCFTLNLLSHSFQSPPTTTRSSSASITFKRMQYQICQQLLSETTYCYKSFDEFKTCILLLKLQPARQ